MTITPLRTPRGHLPHDRAVREHAAREHHAKLHSAPPLTDAPALDSPTRDMAAAERAASAFLDALGVDLTAEGLAATPGRMARAYAELLTARDFEPTTFPNDEGYDELVLARAIPIRSV